MVERLESSLEKSEENFVVLTLISSLRHLLYVQQQNIHAIRQSPSIYTHKTQYFLFHEGI